MGRISFENYGKRAELLSDFTFMAGRYPSQKEAERLIILDIIKKLKILPQDKCQDIGCGVGNILIPISFFVEKITGIDHSFVIDKLTSRLSDLNNVELIKGNFLDLKIKKIYNKIIVYSVLHCLENEVLKFIYKATSPLAPGGKILFGDIPNISKKIRFQSSSYGKEFIKEWERKQAESKNINHLELSKLNNLPNDDKIIEFDDDFILRILKKLRDDNYQAYVLSQPPELPFGYSREDILLEKLL